MQEKFDISVILVVYKTLEWIEEGIASVLSQSHTSFELIIISNDDDAEMDRKIKQCIDGADNVTYVVNEKNVGGATACNMGIRLAKGDFVFFMDSDDKLPGGTLKRLHKAALESGSEIVIGRGKILRGGKKYNVDYVPDRITWERELTVDSVEEAPFLTFNPYYWGRLYSRRMLIENGVFLEDGALNADRNFNCRALYYARGITVCPEISYYWRKHDSEGDTYKSVTRSRTKRENFLDRVEMMKKTDEFFCKNASERLYRYSRISGLMRLLIPCVDTVNTPDFRSFFLDTMSAYLESFSYDDISSCPFLTYRIKTIAYLVKSRRFEDFDSFLKEEPEYELDGAKAVYKYKTVDVPEEFRTQNRFTLKSVTAVLSQTEKSYVFKCTAPLWEDCNVIPICAYVMNTKKREKKRIRIYRSEIEDGVLKFRFKIKKDSVDFLSEGKDYYISFCYDINLRIGRTKLTDGEGGIIAVSREGERLSLKNGDFIFYK